MIDKNRVFINYFDTISCAGDSPKELFASICEKKESISLNTNYVKDSIVAIGEVKKEFSLNDILLQRLKELLKNLDLKDFSKTLLVIGSSVGGMALSEDIYFRDKNYKNIDYKKHPIDSIAYLLKQHFDFYDDISFSTACTSSANALGYAKEVLEKGIYKNVLVVGIDELSYTTVCGFNSLGVLSLKPCTPFDKNRDGMNVAEGFGVLFLSTQKTKDSIELAGVGYSSDAHHMTQPHPQGLGAIKAMSSALENAKLTVDDIDYINAHGTGTQANDFSELIAIKELFKNSKNTPKVSSTKSTTGHTLGAAGAIEAIICCEVLKNQTIPPNKNLTDIEIDGIDYSFETKKQLLRYALSNSFAFGGNNTSLIFGVCHED